MASSSQKKIASANKQKLNEIHGITAAVLTLCFSIVWFFNRPANLKPFFLFQIPLAVSQYVIEQSCRPKYKYDPVGGYDKIVSAGHDMNQSGLTEYLLDIIYFTWLLDILVVIIGSNKMFYLFLVVPGYAAFKVKGLVSGFFPAKGPEAPREEEKPGKSKRQQKLEKNGRRKIIR